MANANTQTNRGLFLTFEGSEGCGKSTQIRRLSARLEARGRAVTVVREPGGTEIGEEIRHLLQYSDKGHGMTAEAELLLFTASRAQLVREKLKPLLAAGTFVIADRFMDSTDVYQGIARPLNFEDVYAINRFAVGDCLPDVTFLLDMDSAAGRRRALEQSSDEGVADRMEQEPEEFYETVRQGYLTRAKAEPERFCVLDASMDMDSVENEIWKTLTERYDGFCS
jgi:dTMP kinase